MVPILQILLATVIIIAVIALGIYVDFYINDAEAKLEARWAMEWPEHTAVEENFVAIKERREVDKTP